MLLTNDIFIFVILPILALVYYLAGWSRNVQNVILLAGSLLLYGFCEPIYIWVLIGLIFYSYGMGFILEYSQNKKILWTAVAGYAVVLFYFRYATFLLHNINMELGEAMQIRVPEILVPVGISFFVLRGISYLADVYHGKGNVQRNPVNLALYLCFFPQQLAGPVIRYSVMEEQLIDRKETWQKFSTGSCRFLIGLTKITLIARGVSELTDRIFAMETMGVAVAWLGAAAFSLQVYYVFAGYSDMAIGLGLIFGFKWEDNFNYPYTAKSISDFWRRFHITFGNWIREYVYYPLGGSRVENKDKMIRNLFVMCLVSGIWYGSEWTFVFFGVFQFFCILMEKLFNLENNKGSAWIKHVYCLFILQTGWVLFRAEDLVKAGKYFASMFGLAGTGFGGRQAAALVLEYSIPLAAGILFSIPLARFGKQYVYEKKKGFQVIEIIYPFVMIFLFLVCIGLLSQENNCWRFL